MKDRPFLRSLLASALAAALAILGQRYGLPPITIPVPPPAAPTAPEPTVPPAPAPKPPEPGPDVLNAICRIQSGNVGCSATVIGPRRADGRYWVLSAAHCVRAPGQHWTMIFRDGTRAGAIVASIDKESDCCWMLTEGNSQTLPYALLADRSPEVGEPVWHAGYGVHIPSNREDGTVTAGPDSNGQIRFRLSVSSGDSGGGIVADRAGRVVSCVCCTTAPGRVADVWGASVERVRRLQGVALVADDWTPIPIPVREIPKQ